MRSSGFCLIKLSSFPRIFSFVSPGKFTIFTLWLLLRTFSEISFNMESWVNTIFFFWLEDSVWISLFCFELEVGLEFPLYVSNISSFSVTFLFTELVILLVLFFCFRRKLMISSSSISSFSKLNMRFFEITSLLCFAQKCLGVSFQALQTFCSVNFGNGFISSIICMRFWNRWMLVTIKWST